MNEKEQLNQDVIGQSSTSPSSLVNPTPTIIEEKTGVSVFKKVLSTTGILVLLGVLSVAAYVGYIYYNNSEITVGQAVINTINAVSGGEIESGEFTVSIDLIAKDVGKNYSDLATDDMSKQITSQIQDVSFNLLYSGVVNKTIDNKIEASGDLNTSLKNPTGGSLGMFGSQEVALKYKVFSDTFYLNVQKIPAIASMFLPLDFNPYLNQWYSIPTKVTEQYSNSVTGVMSTSTLTVDVQSQITNLFDKSGAFIVTDQKSEKTIKGTAVTAMYIKVDYDKLADEIVRISKEESQKNNIIFSQSQELDIRANIAKFKEIPIANDVIKVLVGNDGYAYGFSLAGDLLDESNNNIGNFNINFSTDNYNQDVIIDRPADARDLNQVIMEISNLISTTE